MTFYLKLLSILLLLQGAGLHGEVKPTDTHLYFLFGGQMKLMGRYMMGVSNSSSVAEPAQVPLLLPKNMDDFQPLEGIKKENIILKDSGIFWSKSFAPKLSIAGIVFQMDTYSEDVALEFQADNAAVKSLKEVAFLMEMDSPLSVVGVTPDEKPQVFGRRQYRRYTVSGDALRAQKNIVITGVPLGRLHLWQVGGVFVLLLILVTLTLTLRTTSIEDKLVI